MRVSPQAVSQWEKSNPAFSASKIQALASFLGVDWKWLDGVHGKDHDLYEEISRDVQERKVPVVDRLQALSFSYRYPPASAEEIKRIMSFLDPKDTPFLQSTEYIGRSAFAFYMDDDHLAPAVRKGDILFFDALTEAKTGDIVFAATLKGKSSIEVVIELFDNLANRFDITGPALHPQLKTNETSDKDERSIVGHIFAVAVEHRRLLRVNII